MLRQKARSGIGMDHLRKLGASAMIRVALIALFGACLSACVTGGGGSRAAYHESNLRPYVVNGRRYTPHVNTHYEKEGLASWYTYPSGRRTASGERFDGRSLAAAHKTLPLPCVVEVTNLDNGRKLKVRVNDRGPFVSGRIIDLTPAAADRLGFRGKGMAHVKVKFIGPAPVADSDQILLAQADAEPSGAAASALDASLF